MNDIQNDIEYNNIHIAQLLAQIADKLQAIEEPKEELVIPRFAGRDDEDPYLFLCKLEAYLTTINRPYDEWTADLQKYLHDKSLQWVQPFRKLRLPWIHFCNLFLEEYNNEDLKGELMVKLHSEKQKPGNNSMLFILRKEALACRLTPDITDVQILRLVYVLLHPQIRLYLEDIDQYSTLQQLESRAMHVERDLAQLGDLAWSNSEANQEANTSHIRFRRSRKRRQRYSKYQNKRKSDPHFCTLCDTRHRRQSDCPNF